MVREPTSFVQALFFRRNIRNTLTGSDTTTGDSVSDVLVWRDFVFVFVFVLLLLSFMVVATEGAVAFTEAAFREAGFATVFSAAAAFATVGVLDAMAATLVGFRWLGSRTGAALSEPEPAIGFAKGAKSAAGRFLKTAFQSFARAIA